MSSKRGQHNNARKTKASGQATGVADERRGTVSVLKTAIQTTKIVALVAALSLASVASQLALHPLYGSTTSSLYFKHVLTIACLVSTLSPSVPAHHIFRVLSVLLAFAPLSAKHLGGLFGRWDSPLWGPVLTQIPLAASFAGLSCILLRDWMVCIPTLCFWMFLTLPRRSRLFLQPPE